MRALLAAVLLIACPLAAAQTWLTASIASYHFERQDYCEVNPGVGFEHALEDGALRLVAGSFQNSYCKASGYVGAAYTRHVAGRVRAGMALVAVSGYENQSEAKRARVLLAPLPTLAWEGERLGVNLVLLPPHENFKGAIGLQLKVRFQ